MEIVALDLADDEAVAGSNQYMIAINESLGYAVRGRFRSAEVLVASLA